MDRAHDSFYSAEMNGTEEPGFILRGVIHDINNYLQIILANLLLADKHLEPAHPGKARLTAASTAIHHAAALVASLPKLVSQQNTQHRRVDLVQIVQDVVDTVRAPLASASIDLQTHYPSEPCWIVGESSQLTRVVANLCMNAREAMPEGGQIVIALGHQKNMAFQDGRLHASWEDAVIFLSVRDTGIGFDPTIRQRIFEPGFTTKGEGHGRGLGLSVVKRIVAQHRGHITVTSALGRGACFVVELPRAWPI